MRKLKIVNRRSVGREVQIFHADTGEDIGSSLGVQNVWYKNGTNGLFLSLDLSPDIEIEQVI